MYEQPRVPQPQGEGYIKELALFLKKNTMDVWKAIQTLSKRKVDLSGVEGGIDEIGQKVDELEERMGSLTAEDVGALPQDGTAADSAKLDGKTWAMALDMLHPVGCIYQSTASTDPGELFGGTWERLKDRFLLAAGDAYAAGSEGGEATVKLTTAQLPSHSHIECAETGDGNINSIARTSKSGSVNGASVSRADWATSRSEHIKTRNTGSGQAHNNMPPYLAVYTWMRTA